MSYTTQAQVDTISALTSQLYRYYTTAYYEGVYSGRLDKSIEKDLIPWLLQFKKDVEAGGGELKNMTVVFKNDRPVLQHGRTVVCSYDAMDNSTMRKLGLPLTEYRLDRKEVEADLAHMIKDLKSGMTTEDFAQKYGGNDVYHGVPELEEHITEQFIERDEENVKMNAMIGDFKAVSLITPNVQTDLALAKFLAKNFQVKVGYNGEKITMAGVEAERYVIRVRCEKKKAKVSVKKDPLKLRSMEVDLRLADQVKLFLKFRPCGDPYITPKLEQVLNEEALEAERIKALKNKK